ncbi:MAG: exodeoxyribonuclease III [Pyrinomonadaceae bacterium]|nr:exodeoxyribonuclease III [Pyrinomonadaceae bacterium]MCX7639939.1 exodeoxyribonuclease III [Pyrinomonadaceae bacterium]MDW8304111.1 exodeoxyribonuclease III [Acidobacteriota bacterium]
MKIATWNVNSILIRLEQVLRWLEETQADVLCLQETKCTDDKFPFAQLKLLGYDSVFLGEKSYNGVAILSKHPVKNTIYNLPDDDENASKRLICAEIQGIKITNVYVPNGTELWSEKFYFKLDWLQRLRKFFDARFSPQEDVILCGDFNIAADERDVWSVEAWEGKLHFSKPERAALQHLKKWGFVDLFRKINGDVKEFSWWNYREGAFQKNHGLRIDYIWSSEKLASKCKNCWIDKRVRSWERPSDHAPVVSEFSYDEN